MPRHTKSIASEGLTNNMKPPVEPFQPDLYLSEDSTRIKSQQLQVLSLAISKPFDEV